MRIIVPVSFWALLSVQHEYTHAFTPPNLVHRSPCPSCSDNENQSVLLDNGNSHGNHEQGSTHTMRNWRFWATDPRSGQTDQGQMNSNFELRHIRAAYMSWCQKFGKGPDETRYPQFVSNFLLMESMARQKGYKMHLNEFADCTADEYQTVVSRAEAVRRDQAAKAAQAAKIRAQQEADGIFEAEAQAAQVRAEALAKRRKAEEEMRKRKEDADREAETRALTQAEILRKAAQAQRQKLESQQEPSITKTDSRVATEAQKNQRTNIKTKDNDIPMNVQAQTSNQPMNPIQTSFLAETQAMDINSKRTQQSPADTSERVSFTTQGFLSSSAEGQSSSKSGPPSSQNQDTTDEQTLAGTGPEADVLRQTSASEDSDASEQKFFIPTPPSLAGSPNISTSLHSEESPRKSSLQEWWDSFKKGNVETIAPSDVGPSDPRMERLQKMYYDWCKAYNKTVDKDRLPIWIDRFLMLENFSKEAGLALKLNEYADRTLEEYTVIMNASSPAAKQHMVSHVVEQTQKGEEGLKNLQDLGKYSTKHDNDAKEAFMAAPGGMEKNSMDQPEPASPKNKDTTPHYEHFMTDPQGISELELTKEANRLDIRNRTDDERSRAKKRIEAQKALDIKSAVRADEKRRLEEEKRRKAEELIQVTLEARASDLLKDHYHLELVEAKLLSVLSNETMALKLQEVDLEIVRRELVRQSFQRKRAADLLASNQHLLYTQNALLAVLSQEKLELALFEKQLTAARQQAIQQAEKTRLAAEKRRVENMAVMERQVLDEQARLLAILAQTKLIIKDLEAEQLQAWTEKIKILNQRQEERQEAKNQECLDQARLMNILSNQHASLKVEAVVLEILRKKRIQLWQEEQARLAEEKARKRAEEERLRIEIEAKKKAEEEILRKEALAKRKAEEERLKTEAEAKKKADEERLREEAEVKRKAEDERLRIQAEAKKKADEERIRKEANAKRSAEEGRLRIGAEAKRKAAEERLKKAASKRKSEEERVKMEAEAKKKLGLERLKEREAKWKAEEERLRTEAEAKKKIDEERLRIEAEAKKKAGEERLKNEIEAKRKAEEERIEAEAKKKAEEDRLRKEAEAKRRAEEEGKKAEEERLKEGEAKRKTEEGRLRIEAEMKKKTEKERSDKKAEAKKKEESLKIAAQANTEAQEIRRMKEEETKRIAEEESLRTGDKTRTMEERLRQEVSAKSKANEERPRIDAEAKKKAEEERPKETVAKKKAEEGRLRIKAEIQKRADEERLMVVEGSKRKAEEERLKVKAKDKKKEEEERLRRVAEANKKSEEEFRKMETKAKMGAEKERLMIEGEVERKAGEERFRKATQAKRKAENERLRIEAVVKKDAEEGRLRKEAEARTNAKEEEFRIEVETQSEEGRLRIEAETKNLMEDVELKKKVEEERLRVGAAAQAKRLAEDEGKKNLAVEEEKKVEAERQAKRVAEEKARQKRLTASAEAKMSEGRDRRKQEEAENSRQEAMRKIEQEKLRQDAKTNAEIIADVKKNAEEEAKAKENALADGLKRLAEIQAKQKAQLEPRPAATFDASEESSSKKPASVDSAEITEIETKQVESKGPAEPTRSAETAKVDKVKEAKLDETAEKRKEGEQQKKDDEKRKREEDLRVRSAYLDWCMKFNKKPDMARIKQFRSNYLMIEGMAQKEGKEIKLNEYADCSPAEYEREIKLIEAKNKQEQGNSKQEGKTTPDNGSFHSDTDAESKAKPIDPSLSSQDESQVSEADAAPSGKDKISNLTGEWWKSSVPVGHGNGGKEPEKEWWKGLEGLDESMLGLDQSGGSGKGGGEDERFLSGGGVAGISEEDQATIAGADDSETRRRVRSAYSDWCKTFGKKPDEGRFPKFKSNYLIMERIAMEQGREVTLNEFADCTPDEYRKAHQGKRGKLNNKIEDSAQRKERLRRGREEKEARLEQLRKEQEEEASRTRRLSDRRRSVNSTEKQSDDQVVDESEIIAEVQRLALRKAEDAAKRVEAARKLKGQSISANAPTNVFTTRSSDRSLDELRFERSDGDSRKVLKRSINVKAQRDMEKGNASSESQKLFNPEQQLKVDQRRFEDRIRKVSGRSKVEVHEGRNRASTGSPIMDRNSSQPVVKPPQSREPRAFPPRPSFTPPQQLNDNDSLSTTSDKRFLDENIWRDQYDLEDHNRGPSRFKQNIMKLRREMAPGYGPPFREPPEGPIVGPPGDRDDFMMVESEEALIDRFDDMSGYTAPRNYVSGVVSPEDGSRYEDPYFMDVPEEDGLEYPTPEVSPPSFLNQESYSYSEEWSGLDNDEATDGPSNSRDEKHAFNENWSPEPGNSFGSGGNMMNQGASYLDKLSKSVQPSPPGINRGSSYLNDLSRQQHHPGAGMGVGSTDFPERIRAAYRDWCQYYGKAYNEGRLRIFAANFLAVEKYHRETGVSLILNELADMTSEEYQNRKIQ